MHIEIWTYNMSFVRKMLTWSYSQHNLAMVLFSF